MVNPAWKDQRRHSLKFPGIYKITNKVTGEFYIGASCHIARRWIGHVNELYRGRHPSKSLTESCRKAGYVVGDDNILDFIEIELLERTVYLREKEMEWFEKLKPPLNNQGGPFYAKEWG